MFSIGIGIYKSETSDQVTFRREINPLFAKTTLVDIVVAVALCTLGILGVTGVLPTGVGIGCSVCAIPQLLITLGFMARVHCRRPQ